MFIFCNLYLISTGILVTGGEGAETSLEVVKEDGTACNMLIDLEPDTANVGRSFHTINGLTICGGISTLTSCITLSSGEWITSHKMNESRYTHLSWNSPVGIFLLGGAWEPTIKTAELLSQTTSTSAPAFQLSFDT